MSIIDAPRPADQIIAPDFDRDPTDYGNPDPTAEDLAEHRAMLAAEEAAREPWASWPAWTDERWTIEEPEAFGQPVGAGRLPQTDLDLAPSAWLAEGEARRALGSTRGDLHGND